MPDKILNLTKKKWRKKRKKEEKRKKEKNNGTRVQTKKGLSSTILSGSADTFILDIPATPMPHRDQSEITHE